MLDLLIIGGGPIGLACALEAKTKGLTYLIVEKGTLVNSLYNYPAGMTFFSTSDKLEIGGVPFVSNSIKPTRAESLEYYRRVTTSNQLNIHLFEAVLSNQLKNNHYEITTTKAVYQAKNIIIATGFYDVPVKMNIPGEDLPKVRHYYKDPNFYTFQKVLVVGASNSSVDAALETFRKGAEVTMVVRGDDISERVKYWVRPDIINRIKEGTIKAYYHSNLVAIQENEVDIQTPEGFITIQNDFVLALTGYQPDFSFLQKMGIALSADEKRLPEYDPGTMETNQKGIYLAGVVCGGMDTHSWFIENSRVHAEQIISNIVKQNVPVSAQI
ncbi:YpdA family putative bacillithiol disulfide reductase [uncultured Mucilaginibacter sp.]|uniref:YpdA family putative bacillithiol disulfide reductase n=1 Tax=uncultured Mucilaginibacter sp. TaxID=797541 RepID=UPI00262810D5|nr:YpdA family putative bacillithiol disulfide reductase [uncultured Mucilaginibacter sp.]